MVNHFYFYGLDEDFGPFFLKFCTYFPYNAKLCINGHEYVKRQLAKEGIAFEALDNGILTCANPDGCNSSATACRPPRSTRCCESGWGDCLTRSPLGPRGRLPLRRVDPPGRVLVDPGPGPAAERSHLLRGGDPREPRPRPARPGAIDLRPAGHASGRRAGSGPGCSPRE